MKIDYNLIKEEYQQLQDGIHKMTAIEKAIQLADEEKDYDCSLKFRYDYIKQSVFDDDEFKALVVFPQYVSIYDSHKELHNSNVINMLWLYKWILVSALSFYQISLEDIRLYLKDFKKRLKENGYSLRIYYYIFSDYIECIDKEKYKTIANKYLNYKRDRLSDCETCELNNQVYYEINYGSFEKAMEKAKPILIGQKKCGFVPASTYNNILNYYLDKNDIKNAERYEKLFYKEISTNITFLTHISTMLDYCSIANLDKGLKIFKKHLNWDLKSKNPWDKFNFELSSYKLFKNIKKNQNIKTIKILLDKNFPLYKKDGIYDIDSIIDYYKTNVIDIADKFDSRNKNNYFRKKLD